jgi:protein ImuB
MTASQGVGIEIMRLAATLADSLAPKQMSPSLTEEPEADVSDLIDTLATSWRTASLSLGSGRERRAGMLRSEARAGGARYRRGSRRPAPRQVRRWSRADVWRMERDAELSTVRDYFRVEDEAGERFWIYRSGDGEDATTGSHRWFLHGIFG